LSHGAVQAATRWSLRFGRFRLASFAPHPWSLRRRGWRRL